MVVVISDICYTYIHIYYRNASRELPIRFFIELFILFIDTKVNIIQRAKHYRYGPQGRLSLTSVIFIFQ